MPVTTAADALVCAGDSDDGAKPLPPLLPVLSLLPLVALPPSLVPPPPPPPHAASDIAKATETAPSTFRVNPIEQVIAMQSYRHDGRHSAANADRIVLLHIPNDYRRPRTPPHLKQPGLIATADLTSSHRLPVFIMAVAIGACDNLRRQP